ncbi:MAG: anion permease, partial [Thioalkalivibrio sp.]|nr:anion permease [Thioalkalivibrio sp.]
TKDEAKARSTSDYFKDLYGIDYAMREVRVGDESRLAGTSIGEFEKEYGVFVIGLDDGDQLLIEPTRDAEIVAGGHLAILGPIKDIETASDRDHIELGDRLNAFARSMSPRHSGIAELIIPPGSALIGESIGELHMRQTYGLTVLRIQRGKDVLRDDLSGVEFQSGDTLVVHTRWERLMELEDDRDFIVMTSRYPKPKRPEAPCKVWPALASTAVALALVLFSDLPLALALLGGALGMVLTGVLSMDDAYRAVSWKTVFLLAGLIPLGLAVQNSGAAEWIAVNGMNLIGDVPIWVMQAMLFLLVTFFTLFISNVGATVLLVPLSVSFALVAQANGIDADPRVFALIVAIAASNAFLLPTHQVNALILDPGGYRVIDFLRAGGLLTVLYLAVALLVINLLF